MGDPTGGGVISRVVTLRVERVLVDHDPLSNDHDQRRATSLVVEEEGWLVDGTPIIVTGMAP